MKPRRRKLVLDPSRPHQVGEDLLALWLPPGSGRDAPASGLVMTAAYCTNPECGCTEAQLHAAPVDDRAVEVAGEGDRRRWWAKGPARPPAAPPRADVGRNDPCPCGSGKKHKHCCGR